MPPLWLIIGAVVIGGIISAIDRMILKPRGATFIVDGKTVQVRRKRDGQLLMAINVVMLGLLFVIGVTLVEESNLTLILLLALPFGAVAVWSMWRAFRADDRPPTEKEVRVGVSATRTINRHAWRAFAFAAGEMAVTALVGTTEGILSWILLVVSLALLPFAIWHTWRLLRAIRETRSASQSI
jgi:hypothetical protein